MLFAIGGFFTSDCKAIKCLFIIEKYTILWIGWLYSLDAPVWPIAMAGGPSGDFEGQVEISQRESSRLKFREFVTDDRYGAACPLGALELQDPRR